jgi:hypothetical protein
VGCAGSGAHPPLPARLSNVRCGGTFSDHDVVARIGSQLLSSNEVEQLLSGQRRRAAIPSKRMLLQRKLVQVASANPRRRSVPKAPPSMGSSVGRSRGLSPGRMVWSSRARSIRDFWPPPESHFADRDFCQKPTCFSGPRRRPPAGSRTDAAHPRLWRLKWLGGRRGQLVPTPCRPSADQRDRRSGSQRL